MREKLRIVCDLLLGLLFILSSLIGYGKDPSHMSEYCFISGMLVGVILTASSVYGIRKRRAFPTWLYFDCVISTIIIFIATIAIKLNLEGAFWFIHIINPLLLFCCWFVFCDHTDLHLKYIFTDIVFPVCYFIFALILYKSTGVCPFPASLILVDSSAGQAALGAGALILLFILLGYVFHSLNRLAHRKKI